MVCKYTHLFDKVMFFTLKIHLNRNFRSRFLQFLCVTKFEGLFGMLFFFVTLNTLDHAAYRKKMHTIYKVNKLFISKALNIQSCIQQFS